MSAGALAGVGSAALGVDVEAVRAGGEAADGAADAQRRQVRALLQRQVAAHSAPCANKYSLSRFSSQDLISNTQVPPTLKVNII